MAQFKSSELIFPRKPSRTRDQRVYPLASSPPAASPPPPHSPVGSRSPTPLLPGDGKKNTRQRLWLPLLRDTAPGSRGTPRPSRGPRGGAGNPSGLPGRVRPWTGGGKPSRGVASPVGGWNPGGRCPGTVGVPGDGGRGRMLSRPPSAGPSNRLLAHGRPGAAEAAPARNRAGFPAPAGLGDPARSPPLRLSRGGR